MAGTFVLKMPMDGAVGAAPTEQTGKTLSVNGISLAAAADCSGGIGALVTDAFQYISVSDAATLSLAGEFSIGGAVRLAELPPVYTALMEMPWTTGLRIYPSGSVVFFYPGGELDAGDVVVGSRATLLVTRDAANVIRVFNNGTLISSETWSGELLGSAYEIMIGKGYDYGASAVGVIDDLFIVEGAAIQVANYTPTLGMPSLSGGGDPDPDPDPEPEPDGDPYSVALGLRVQVAQPYSAALALRVTASDGRAFDTSLGKISWAWDLRVAGIDFSSRLLDESELQGGEDSAAVATFTVQLQSDAELAALPRAPVTIDVLVSGGGYSARRRRFTGRVEDVDFDLATCVATLTCSDGYQDRVKAAGSALAVMQLTGGLATVSPKITAWNDAQPAPWAYFTELRATMPGATYIDGAGVWRVVRWDLGAPARVYAEGDMFDPGATLRYPETRNLPRSIVGTLTHTFPRLHNAEVSVSWEAFPEYESVLRGVPYPQKSMVVSALEGFSDWLIKGNPVLVTPTPGNYPAPGHDQYFTVSHEAAPFLIKSMDATFYRRWYQMVERRYKVTIDLGGDAEADESVARAITTTFDADGWETGRKAAPSLGIYAANPPPGSGDEEELTGYEALQSPWPPTNGALDHFGDLTAADVELAVSQMVAEATRLAAAGRRQRSFFFERPVDLRLEVGDVVEVALARASGVGQLVEFVERYNHVTSECVGGYTFACPEGEGSTTGFSVSLTVPPVSVTHAFPPVTLGNHIGADANTPMAWVPPDTLVGYLCNTLSDPEKLLESDLYDPLAPVYETQFRILLPALPAALRDPLEQVVDVEGGIALADGGLIVSF